MLLKETLGEIACRIPGATQVFHHHRLDFCCGGNKSLGEAALARQVSPDAIVSELEALLSLGDSAHADWRERSKSDLIVHILHRYHERHRVQLPEIIRLASKVERVHGERPECPLGLAAHLQNMLQELDSHMQKEEQMLFPMLLQGKSVAQVQAPIGVMRMEHDHHGEAVAKLDALTQNITAPQGACNTWRALYMGLQQFKEDLMEHIHLENNILFR